jgi:5'-nucleotidase
MSANRIPLPWADIDTVLLDMDGTLLDLHFDNHFWQTHLPRRYAQIHGAAALTPDALTERFRAHVGTLPWYSVDFWASDLSVDIMALKNEVAHLINVHPHVEDFLRRARCSGKRIVLATNAHHKALALKLARTSLETYFDAIVSSHSFNAAKESPDFWRQLHAQENYDPARTLLVDDTLSVLDAAHAHGIAHLVAVRTPDTRAAPKDTEGYLAIDDFSQLFPPSANLP